MTDGHVYYLVKHQDSQIHRVAAPAMSDCRVPMNTYLAPLKDRHVGSRTAGAARH